MWGAVICASQVLQSRKYPQTDLTVGRKADEINVYPVPLVVRRKADAVVLQGLPLYAALLH